MAIDTAEKRKSAATVLSPWAPASVTPNASKDSEWRVESGWGYSGIAISAVVPTVRLYSPAGPALVLEHVSRAIPDLGHEGPGIPELWHGGLAIPGIGGAS